MKINAQFDPPIHWFVLAHVAVVLGVGALVVALDYWLATALR